MWISWNQHQTIDITRTWKSDGFKNINHFHQLMLMLCSFEEHRLLEHCWGHIAFRVAYFGFVMIPDWSAALSQEVKNAYFLTNNCWFSLLGLYGHPSWLFMTSYHIISLRPDRLGGVEDGIIRVWPCSNVYMSPVQWSFNSGTLVPFFVQSSVSTWSFWYFP